MKDYSNNELLFRIRYEKQKKINKLMEFFTSIWFINDNFFIVLIYLFYFLFYKKPS